jgi:hypothetical protein
MTPFFTLEEHANVLFVKFLAEVCILNEVSAFGRVQK